MLILICLISLLIALPGFLNKAGYSLWKGFIPGYNIYLFLRVIEFPITLLLLISLGLIFLPDRVFCITLLFVLLPFITSDAFGKGKVYGLLCLFLPFIFYPYLGYLSGIYCLDVSDNHKSFIKRHKLLTVILILLSFYIYFNYTRLVESNELVDKSSPHYVNDLYMSDGRIYNNFLTDNEKKMYMFLLNQSKSYKMIHEINMSEYEYNNYQDLGSLIEKSHYALLADHPELINYSGFSWKYYDGKFTLTLDFSVGNFVKAYIGETRIKRIISNIKEDTKDMNDLEKIKYVYEWIGMNNTYDKVFTYSSKNQSIYNVFMNKNAVCAGFAKASAVIFQNIGITAYTITGESTGPHMWNIINYNDKWYFYDSTIATGRTEGSSSYYDGLRQEYMNFYTVHFPTWYPEYEKTNGLYQ